MQSLDVISVNIWHILISLANLAILFFVVKRFLFAPVSKGDLVGKIVYYLDDVKIASLDIYATESVKSINYKKSIFERIFG